MQSDGLKGQSVASPSKAREIMDRYGLRLKKSLGQNFLIDRHILDRITAAAELDRSKAVLEIGPGIGALTQRLGEAAGKVVAVEIDQRLISILHEVLAPQPNVTVVHGDILKVDLRRLLREHFPDHDRISVAANLPYYVTTPILMKLLEGSFPFEHIVVMIQKEVAERIAAVPGSKAYGSLSVAVRYYCVPEIVGTVPRTVFIPQPNVDSAIIRLRGRAEPPVHVPDEPFFFKLVQASFAQRRKTIFNNLRACFKTDHDRLAALLVQCGIDPARRGETLSLQEFASLAHALYPLRPALK